MNLEEALTRLGLLDERERVHQVHALVRRGRVKGLLLQAHGREWGLPLSMFDADRPPDCPGGCGLTIAE